MLGPLQVAGQTPAKAATKAGKTWTAPRTPDGQPDLQGVWLSNTATPLERPKALEGRARLTDAEVAEFRRRADRLFRGGNSDFAVGDGVYQAILSNPSSYRNTNAKHGAAEMVDLEFDNRTSLVVETTNFSPQSFFMGATDDLQVVERFTRTASDRIEHVITVTDPTTWARPWTAMMPLRQRHEPLFEYAQAEQSTRDR